LWGQTGDNTGFTLGLRLGSPPEEFDGEGQPQWHRSNSGGTATGSSSGLAAASTTSASRPRTGRTPKLVSSGSKKTSGSPSGCTNRWATGPRRCMVAGRQDRFSAPKPFPRLKGFGAENHRRPNDRGERIPLGK